MRRALSGRREGWKGRGGDAREEERRECALWVRKLSRRKRRMGWQGEKGGAEGRGLLDKSRLKRCERKKVVGLL